MLRSEFTGATFELSKCPNALSPGIYEFGRSLLIHEDMRVSRSQVQLNVWPDRASITRKGKNLTCIKRGSEVIHLEIDRPQELKPDDTVFLLVSLYPIRFHSDNTIRSVSNLSSMTDSAAIPAPANQAPPGNPKKRLREETPNLMAVSVLDKLQIDESLENSDDEGIVLLAKKPKMAETIAPVPKALPSAGHWSTGLLAYLKDPSSYPDSVIMHNEELVVIKDKYPKSTLHLLIMPRQSIQNPSHLKKEHLELVVNMENLASKLAAQWMARDKTVNFGSVPDPKSYQVLIGFHAIPSMSQLHLHVISNDFNSPSLKSKKHWNSFNSPFFIPPSHIIQKLQKGESITFDKGIYEAYVDGPMKCHRCGTSQSTMPALKNHIATCSVK